MPPSPTSHGVVAHYDHLPTAGDIAAVAAAGGTNIVTIRLANCRWFETVVDQPTLISRGVVGNLVDDTANVEPVYVYYPGGATPADSTMLALLSAAPHHMSVLSDSVLATNMRLDQIDLLARDPKVRSVYIVNFIYPI